MIASGVRTHRRFRDVTFKQDTGLQDTVFATPESVQVKKPFKV
jgi:hypothetical protein